MKVLHILNSLEFSGAETMLAMSAKDFRAVGLDVECLSTGALEGPYAAVMRENGIEVSHLAYRASLSFWWGLRGLLRQRQADIVHVHPEKAAFRYMLVARMAGAQVVVRTVHSVFAPTGIRALLRRLSRASGRALLGAKYIFISETVQSNERARFGTVGSLVRNCVDEREFYPAVDAAERERLRSSFSVPLDASVVATAGSCLPVKRHADLLEAVARVRTPVHVLHAGSGPLEAEERARAEALGLSARVRFLGSVRDMRSVFVAADVLVMPSEYEGLSLAAAEAGACGVPTIAYDVPGLRDLVDDNVTGIIARPEDPTGLASAIEVALGAPHRRVGLGSEARHRVLARYRRQYWLDRHLEIYQSGIVRS